MTRQDLVNKSIDKLNTVKEALELINILEYDECIAVLTGTKNLPSEIHSALMRRGKEANGGKTTLRTVFIVCGCKDSSDCGGNNLRGQQKSEQR